MEYATKTCRQCGKDYLEKRSGSAFCSPHCRSEYKNSKGGNRPFTQDTVYLCQKWQREGLQVRSIAKILRRSPENIMQALEIKLPSSAYESMEMYRR